MKSTDVVLDELVDLVDGELRPTGTLAGPRLQDPSTGADLQDLAGSSAQSVEDALAAATRVHAEGSWSSLPVEERAGWLDKMAAALEPYTRRVAELESLTTGAPISQTEMLAFIVHAAFGLAAGTIRSGVLSSRLDGPTGRAVEVERSPVGPALCLVPWNAPAPMAAHKVASALAAGAPAILKPSEMAPNGTNLIARAAAEVGLPAGVLQLLHGGRELGAQLVDDRRIRSVSFTGGLAGGRAIAASCAAEMRPAQLELGGNNPLVVLPDSSPEAVAAGVVGLMTTLNAQWCRALGRLVLPAARADELLEAILAALGQVQVGDALDDATQMGPIIHTGHRLQLQSQLDALLAAGGTAHVATALPDGPGTWMAPTLVTGVSDADCQHEIFGPVAAVLTYDTVDEAVALANGTPYGLEAYVIGADEDAAMAVGRRIMAGGVKVNGTSPLSLNLMAPRPGWGLSGLGSEGTVETITFFTESRTIGVEGSLLHG